MTRNIYLFALLASSFILFTSLDPSNPPVGVTGAPNEKTCSTQSGCHSGGSYTGTVVINGLPDTIVAGNTYTIKLKVTAPTANRGGFEITALNGTNTASGTFSTGSGVSIKTSGGKNYARQSSAKSYVADTIAWSFPWKAPATGKDSTTFYFVGLAANGNGKNSGDNAFKNSKTVYYEIISATNDPAQINQTTIYPNPAEKEIKVKSTNQKGLLAIYDIMGKKVYSTSYNQNESIDVSSLPRGKYIVETKENEIIKRHKLILK